MPEPTPFAQVLDEELRLIEKRRLFVDRGITSDHGLGADLVPVAAADADKRLMELRVQALKRHTTGLTFSGGGIRAGTFAVGILQGLATLGLLKRVDYLSTVSGGGYAGAWLAAWLKRQGDVEDVEKQLNPNRVAQSKSDRLYLKDQVVDEEPEPVRHLRAYSSFMTPRAGMFTADTWTILMIWSRNILINVLMLLPLAMLAVLIARAILRDYQMMNAVGLTGSTDLSYASLGALGLGGLLLGLGFGYNASVLREFRHRDPGRRLDRSSLPYDMTRVVVPAIVVGTLQITLGIRGVLWRLGDGLGPARSDGGFWHDVFLKLGSGRFLEIGGSIQSHLGLLEFPCVALHVLGFGLLFAAGALLNGLRNRILKGKYVSSAFFAGCVGGGLLSLLEALIRYLAEIERPDLMAICVVPLALTIVVVSLMVEVALMGRAIEEAEREWWSRFAALNMISALGWLFAMATIFYVPYVILNLRGLPGLLTGSAWGGSAFLGVIWGRVILPSLGGKSTGLKVSLTTLASAAATFFLVGLMGLVGLLVGAILDPPLADAAGTPIAAADGSYQPYLHSINNAPDGLILLMIAACVVVYRGARRLIDVNLFSINAMYANRLIRCYLGASRRREEWVGRWGGSPRDTSINTGSPSLGGVLKPGERNDPLLDRDANPVTGFDPKDDFDLVDLRIGLAGREGERRYWGPHLLINTTLNLVGQDNLAWRDRKGESFTLSPLYCGSKGTGYARLPETSPERENMTLGRAISISGAAIDPNMSFYQSASLTALLTVFNARLGYWLEKPRPVGWKANPPRFGDLLMSEFLGETSGDGDYVHISDGGHFENLGVYELIRRRCRYIVVIDSGEDGEAADDNMSIMIRLCRIDFGVRIHLDTRPLEMAGPDKLTKAHVVIGRIHYDDVDQGEMPGVMVYVKVSLTGDEPPDLLKYARKEPAFPHQATDFRQDFDEEQFECYRCLGEHIAREVFGDAARRFPEASSMAHVDFVPLLFSAVQARWADASGPQADRLITLEHAWGELHRQFRESPALAWLSHDLYPELTAPAACGSHPDRERAELHAVNQMLELMSNVWQGLKLNKSLDLPGKRGWLNTFRRWASTRAFQKCWPLVRSEFDSDFVRFCEAELHLAISGPETVQLSWPLASIPAGSFEADAVGLLSDVFAREWPDEVRVGRSIAGLIGRAEELQRQMGWATPPVWLIVQAPSGNAPASKSADRSVVGIILAATFPDYPQAEARRFPGTTPVEFFAWVRRPFRAVSMGSPCVRQVLNNELLPQLAAAPPGSRPLLWARYPRRSADADTDLEGGIWLNFFARYDFRKYVPIKDNAWTLLVREP